MTRDPSIAVVGGSAAGLFTAHALASRGRPVTVLEGEPQLAPAPRTLIVTSRLRDELGALAEGAVVNRIRRFELFTNGRSATVSLARPDLVIERATLIRTLAARAEAAGATLLTGRRFVGFDRRAPRASLIVEDEARRADVVRAATVVGADGTFSGVARAGGWPAPVTAPLVQAVVALPPDMRADTTRVWFMPEDTPYFYWLIPDSPTRGVLGLIGEDGPRTRRCLERFLERRGVKPLEFQAARIPVYTRWVPAHRRVGQCDVYLVGDAACHVKVTTVGGIVTGFRGAVGVVESIVDGAPSRRLRALRRELDRHLLIRRALHHFRQEDYSRLVDFLGPGAQRVLGTYTRDEANTVLLRLLMTEPRMLLLGLRGLLTHASGALGRSPATRSAPS